MRPTEDMLREVDAFERNPRAEILALLLEAATIAREEPRASKRARALALIARTMLELYPEGSLRTSAEYPALGTSRRAKA